MAALQAHRLALHPVQAVRPQAQAAPRRARLQAPTAVTTTPTQLITASAISSLISVKPTAAHRATGVTTATQDSTPGFGLTAATAALVQAVRRPLALQAQAALRVHHPARAALRAAPVATAPAYKTGTAAVFTPAATKPSKVALSIKPTGGTKIKRPSTTRANGKFGVRSAAASSRAQQSPAANRQSRRG